MKYTTLSQYILVYSLVAIQANTANERQHHSCPPGSTLLDKVHCVCEDDLVCFGTACHKGKSIINPSHFVQGFHPDTCRDCRCVSEQPSVKPSTGTTCQAVWDKEWLDNRFLREIPGHWVPSEPSHIAHNLEIDRLCPFFWEGFWCPDAQSQNRKMVDQFIPFNCSLSDFNAEDIIDTLQNRTLFFVGDSLMRQTFLAISCRLNSALRTKATENVNSYRSQLNGVEKWRRGFNSACGEFPKGVAICYFEAGKKRGASPGVLHTIKSGMKRMVITGNDIVVVNHGVHFSGNKLKQLTEDLITFSQQEDAPLFIWRETLPQHFPDGQYTDGDEKLTQSPCNELSNQSMAWGSPDDPVANKYNSITNPILEGTNIPILKLWRMTAMQPHRHLAWPGSENNARDCTHYCMADVPAAWGNMFATFFSTNLFQKKLKGRQVLSHHRNTLWQGLLEMSAHHWNGCPSKQIPEGPQACPNPD